MNSFKKSFKETCKYVFSYILDDRIIYSWCLNVLNIRFKEMHCIRCFDQNFKSFSISKFISYFIRAPIESERLSKSEYDKPSLYKLTTFPIELGRDFTLLVVRSRTFKCVNFPMLSRRDEIFVLETYKCCKFIRALIESGRLSSS